MRRTRLVGALLAGLVVVAAFGAPSPARAQEYPPPTDTPAPTDSLEGSVVVRGTVSCGVEVSVADRRSPIDVEGSVGFADPNETGNVFVIYNPTLAMGSFTARADGSFLHRFVLPEEVPAGSHIVRVSLNSRGDTDLSLRVTDVVYDCETDVLGTQATPSVASGVSTAGGDGGLLPKTGLDFLLLILWALILILLGTVLVVSSWRWAHRFETVRVVGSRARRGPPSRQAVPESEVPFIDTSGFDPLHRSQGSSRARRPAGSGPSRSASEWDDKPKRRRKT